MTTDLRGLIYPDPRLTPASIVAAASSYTQTGGLAGQPSGSAEAAGLETAGTPPASGYLEIKTTRGGFAASSLTAAGFVWRDSASGPWHGLDEPWRVAGWEWVVRRANGGSDSDTRPHVIELASGAVLLATHRATASAQRVDVRKLTPGVGWGAAVTASSGSDIPTASHPALLQLPSGRVLLYHWTTASDAAYLRVMASDDDGATWQTVADRVGYPISVAAGAYTLGRLRAAYSQGTVIVFASLLDNATARYVAQQWASDANGYTLAEVILGDSSTSATADAQKARAVEVVAHPGGGFIMTYFHPPTSEWRARQLSSAWTPYIYGSEPVEIPSFVTADPTQSALWYVGRTLYILVPYILGGETVAALSYSRDDGAEWFYGQVWTNEADLDPSQLTACAVRGQTVYVGRVATTATAFDNDSLIAHYAGGWSAPTWPALYREAPRQIPTSATWIGVEDPVNFDAYTRTATGVPTEAITATGWSITTGAAVAVYYQTGLGASVTDAVVAEVDLAPSSGGATTADRIALVVNQGNGTADYRLSVRFTTTAFRVWDTNGGTALATITTSTTAGIRVRVLMRGASCTVWYRSTGAASQSAGARTWTLAAASTTLVANASSPLAFGHVRWGHVSASAAVSEWRMAQIKTFSDTSFLGLRLGGYELKDDTGPYASQMPIGADMTAGQMLPGLFGASADLPGGTRVRLLDGPTGAGDTWTSVAQYVYGVDKLHPLTIASPRREWRATQDAADEYIAWALPDTASNAVLSETGSVGMYLGRANFRYADLAGWDGTTWTTLGTLDLAAGLTSLPFVRRGDSIVVDTSAASPTAAAWLHRGELVGGTVAFAGGVSRRIARSTSGRWTSGTLSPTIYLETVSGAEPTSGTIDIWRPAGVLVVNAVGSYRRVRVTFRAAATVEDYLRAGVCLIGPWLPLEPYSWGRSLELIPDVELVDVGGGGRVSRVRGPARRTVAVSWREGIPTVGLYDGAAPPYLAGSHAIDGRAVGADTPSLLAGLIDELDGAASPVVLVGALRSGVGTATQSSTEATIYGRITGTVAREVVIGDELWSEVQRVGELLIEEEL
jgi:hypothetical protein